VREEEEEEEEEEEDDTAGVSDATPDSLWPPMEAECERVSMEMKEAELEGVASTLEEVREDDEGAGEEEEKAEGKVGQACVPSRVLLVGCGQRGAEEEGVFPLTCQMCCQMLEEPDEDSQCLSDDTDTEISTQVLGFILFDF